MPVCFLKTTDLSSCEGTIWLTKPKISATWPFTGKLANSAQKYFSLSFSKPEAALIQSEDYLGEWLPLGSAVCRKSHLGSGGLCGQELISSEQGLFLKIAARLHLHPPPQLPLQLLGRSSISECHQLISPGECCFTDLDQIE